MRRLGEDAQMLILVDSGAKTVVKASVLHVLASSLKETHKTDPVVSLLLTFIAQQIDSVEVHSPSFISF